jgi:hypothetical protein
MTSSPVDFLIIRNRSKSGDDVSVGRSGIAFRAAALQDRLK